MILPDRILDGLLLVVAGLLLVILLFGAYAVVLRLRSMALEARTRRLHAEWTQTIMEVLVPEAASGEAPPGAAMHEVVVEPRDRILFLDFVMDHARALRKPERSLVEGLATPHIREVLPELRSTDPLRRARGAEILGQLGLPSHHRELLAALGDPSGIVAMVAARALAREGDPAHLEAILRELPRLEDWSPHYLASLLLSFGPPAAPRLRALMEDRGAPPGLRGVAAEALAGLNDLEAADLAASCLKEVTDADLATDLLRLMAKLGHGDHVPGIRPFVYRSEPHVRAAALRALGALGGAEGDMALLRLGLSDPSPWVAIHAARGLRESGGEDELETLARSGGSLATLAGEVLLEGP